MKNIELRDLVAACAFGGLLPRLQGMVTDKIFQGVRDLDGVNEAMNVALGLAPKSRRDQLQAEATERALVELSQLALVAADCFMATREGHRR